LEKIRKTFYELVDIGAPSGFEEPMIIHMRKALEPNVDRVLVSKRGNVIGIQEGLDPDSPKVALVAHMDQVGFVVFNIDEKGFIYFRRAGGIAKRALQGQPVRILTGKGPVKGVIGVKHGHTTTPEEANRLPPYEEYYIDIGAYSKEDTLNMGVKVGTPIVFDALPVELGNDQIASKCVDDRAGLTAVLMVAETLKNLEIPSTVYYVGAIEEEVGLRGSEVALYNLDVDLAIAIDTFPAGYQPDVEMRDIFYEVGKGPAIHVGEIGSGNVKIQAQVVANWLRKVAEAEGIQFQSGLMHGGTDAMALMQTRGGLPATTIGVPRKYSHSPIETFDLKDLERLIGILVSALTGLNKGVKFDRV